MLGYHELARWRPQLGGVHFSFIWLQDIGWLESSLPSLLYVGKRI
jgi:hypothetical protein